LPSTAAVRRATFRDPLQPITESIDSVALRVCN
jgi:hypothetical protein